MDRIENVAKIDIAELVSLKSSGKRISNRIIAHNLELCNGGELGFLNQRLLNHKFNGPDDSLTGLPKPWREFPMSCVSGFMIRLQPGAGLRGSDGLKMENYSDKRGYGIMQDGVRVRAGETIRVSVTARAQANEAVIKVGVRSMDTPLPDYGSAEIKITKPYYSRYYVDLKMPFDDDNAVFFITLEGYGSIAIDRAELGAACGGRINPPTEEALKDFPISVLRFPGGCMTTSYHWEEGIGDCLTRRSAQDPKFKSLIDYDFGTDEYLDLCIKKNITPEITVNISTGTPDEAEAWALYIKEYFKSKELEPPMIYWQIGNEQFGSWEVGHSTPEMYVETLKAYVPKLRRAYPNSRIIALGPENGDKYCFSESHFWRKKVIAEAGELFDVLAAPCYWGNGFSEDKREQYFSSFDGVSFINSLLCDMIRDLDAEGLSNKNVSVSEWNLWYHANLYAPNIFEEPYDMQHIIYCASVFNAFVRLSPRFELGNFYNLFNCMGIFRSYGAEVEETPLAELFRQYSKVLSGELFDAEVSCPNIREGLSKLDIIAAKNDLGFHYIVINRDLDSPMLLRRFDIPKGSKAVLFTGLGVEKGYILRKFDIEYEITVPPMSIMVITV